MLICCSPKPDLQIHGSRLIEGEPQEKLDLQTVTLEDFLAFDDVKNYVTTRSHSWLRRRRSPAQAAMEKDEDCQDISVTKTGTGRAKCSDG